MNTTKEFQEIISAHLELNALRDPLFAKALKKPNKSIKECVNYILETVKNKGVNGCEDNYVYGLAIHYYDEDNVKSKNKTSVKVVVNHTVNLTQEEIDEAKKDGYNLAVKEAQKKAIIDFVPELTSEEIAKAKADALNKITEKEIERMTKKKSITKEKAIESTDVLFNNLFQSDESSNKNS